MPEAGRGRHDEEHLAGSVLQDELSSLAKNGVTRMILLIDTEND